MAKSSVARVRRRAVLKGMKEELRRRGVNPDSPEAIEMVKKRIAEKELEERYPHGYR